MNIKYIKFKINNIITTLFLKLWVNINIGTVKSKT